MNKQAPRLTRREILRTGLRGLSAMAVGTCTLGRALSASANHKPESPPPTMAIIIDDIGYSRRALDRFLRLDIPLTFAVLPHLKHSAHAAFRISDAGHDMMLHQPMEPVGKRFHPGPGGIYVRQHPDRITRIVEENLTAVPGATGVNNHMGSRFTACAEKMRPVVNTIRHHGLHFVDSLTTPVSAAYRTARQENLPTLRRDVFLDNDLSPSAIRRQLVRLEYAAWKAGSAIGIGHPHAATAEALADYFHHRRGAASSLTTVAALVSATAPR